MAQSWPWDSQITVKKTKKTVCLLHCSFKFTGTLIFISAVTGTGVLATTKKNTSGMQLRGEAFPPLFENQKCPDSGEKMP